MHLPRERNPLGSCCAAARNCAPRPTISGALRSARRRRRLVRLAELGRFARSTLEQTIYHKNLERVVYVFGEMAGKSPVNAVLNLSTFFKANPLPAGTSVVWSGEGEWNITLDVFRDLGLAFAAALVLIYILLVIETGSLPSR